MSVGLTGPLLLISAATQHRNQWHSTSKKSTEWEWFLHSASVCYVAPQCGSLLLSVACHSQEVWSKSNLQEICAPVSTKAKSLKYFFFFSNVSCSHRVEVSYLVSLILCSI